MSDDETPAAVDLYGEVRETAAGQGVAGRPTPDVGTVVTDRKAAVTTRTARTCAVYGCGRVHHALGWCAFHHRRWSQSGSVEVLGRGGRRRALALTPLGRAVLAVPPELPADRYVVSGYAAVIDLPCASSRLVGDQQ